jgi:membrane-associated phospholipid phosphatase
VSVLAELEGLDVALYRAVAATPTPTIDRPLRQLSSLANHSKLWLAIAALVGLVGGRRGLRAAAVGVAAIGVTSAVVNLPVKLSAGRRRPDRSAAAVPELRHVPMPTTTSFPSGHSASAFAFAEAVGSTAPVLSVPLRVLASAVGYSRVHTGVHYPGDVLVGALVGATIGEVVARLAARPSIGRRLPGWSGTN